MFGFVFEEIVVDVGFVFYGWFKIFLSDCVIWDGYVVNFVWFWRV